MFVSDNVKKTKKVQILVCLIYHPLVEGLILCVTVITIAAVMARAIKIKMRFMMMVMLVKMVMILIIILIVFIVLFVYYDHNIGYKTEL